MNDLRAKLALKWAEKHNIQLSLFSRQYQKEREATKREEKLTGKVKNEEKFKKICQGIRAGNLDKEEFKQMCKKAKVEPGSLAKTVFPRV